MPFHVVPEATKSKQFSLDFPPGLVDIEGAGEPSEKWSALKRILKGASPEVVQN